MLRLLLRLLPLAALLASACVTAVDVRPLEPSEVEGMEALMQVINDFADSGERRIAPEVRDALRSALDDGRIRFGDISEDGVRGFVRLDMMYLEELDDYSLTAFQENPQVFNFGLMVLYHEGVHLTQGLIMSMKQREEEAYLETHHLQKWLLAQSLRGEASYPCFPTEPRQQLACMFAVRRAVTRLVGEVCPCNRTYHRLRDRMKVAPDFVQGLVEPGALDDRVDFVDDGAGGVVGRWRLVGDSNGREPSRRPTVSRRFPEGLTLGPAPAWTEYLASAASVELSVGWYYVEGPGAEVDLDAWNRDGLVPSIVDVDDRGVELELRIPGPPGERRLVYRPVFFTNHPLPPRGG